MSAAHRANACPENTRWFEKDGPRGVSYSLLIIFGLCALAVFYLASPFSKPWGNALQEIEGSSLMFSLSVSSASIAARIGGRLLTHLPFNWFNPFYLIALAVGPVASIWLDTVFVVLITAFASIFCTMIDDVQAKILTISEIRKARLMTEQRRAVMSQSDS